MSLNIHLSMDETAIAPFREAWIRACAERAELPALAREARAHHAELGATQVPAYLRRQVDLIPEIAELLADDDWQLDEQARHGFAGALVYFNDPRDLIPDAQPKFGLLDDAIVIELAVAENRREWHAWREFAEVRRRHPGLGRMDRAHWQTLRQDLPRLIDRLRTPASYVDGRYGDQRGRTRYRLLADLPRLDMQ